MQIDCELCGVSFRDQTGLETHMRRHAEDVAFDGAVFECGNCDRSYPVRDDLDRHVHRKHTA